MAMMLTGTNSLGAGKMSETGATRRSQPERREEMRRRLVAATLDSLALHGHAGASLSVILEKAGVSRGAWAHHFDTKAEMLALAAEGLLREAVASAGALAPTTPLPIDGTAAMAMLLEQAWRRFYEGRHRDLLFEVALAARTDAELKQRLAPIFSDFIAAVGQSWGLALRPRPGAGAAVTDLMVLTVYMLRGMAMQELAAGPSPDHARLRALWAGLLAAQVTF
jgi:AcrR family transcriptional regulator